MRERSCSVFTVVWSSSFDHSLDNCRLVWAESRLLSILTAQTDKTQTAFKHVSHHVINYAQTNSVLISYSVCLKNKMHLIFVKKKSLDIMFHCFPYLQPNKWVSFIATDESKRPQWRKTRHDVMSKSSHYKWTLDTWQLNRCSEENVQIQKLRHRFTKKL